MRYEISTSTTTSKDSSGNTYKNIKTTKRRYYTVGDIVGKCETASAAVKALQSKKGDANLKKTAAGALIDPLVALVSSMDVYKKVMGVVSKVVPVARIAARASGMEFSPGNSGEIAKIVFGQIQKILVAMVLSSVQTLKDTIWNMEVELPSVDSEVSILISKAVTEKGNSITTTTNTFITNLEEGINDDSATITVDSSSSAIKSDVDDLKNLSSDSSDDSILKNIISDVLNNGGTYSEVIGSSATSNDALSSSVKTDKDTGKVDSSGNKIYRILAGSNNNKGLYYSDDGGSTWTQSNITEGNWNCITGESGTYCAGGYSIFKSTSDISFTTSKKYYKKINTIYFQVSPKNLMLYEKSTESSFSMSKIYYYLSSGVINIANPSVLGLYEKDGDSYVLSTSLFFNPTIDYYKKETSYTKTSPLIEKLYNISQDTSFTMYKSYFVSDEVDGNAIMNASIVTPYSLGLYEIYSIGKGIDYTTDYGTTWNVTNKTTGDCNKFMICKAANSYPKTIVMASASNEGIWYSTDYSTWTVSDISTGNYNIFMETPTNIQFYIDTENDYKFTVGSLTITT